MKLYKNSIYLSFVIALLSGLLYFIFGLFVSCPCHELFQHIMNISLGIFGSAVVSLLIFISQYKVEKKEKLVEFVSKTNQYCTYLLPLKYFPKDGDNIISATSAVIDKLILEHQNNSIYSYDFDFICSGKKNTKEMYNKIFEIQKIIADTTVMLIEIRDAMYEVELRNINKVHVESLLRNFTNEHFQIEKSDNLLQKIFDKNESLRHKIDYNPSSVKTLNSR